MLLYHNPSPLFIHEALITILKDVLGKLIYLSWLLGFMVVLSNCSPKITQVDLPYDSLPEFTLSGDATVPDKWWQVFNDQQLDSLMEIALVSNLPLNVSWYQFRESGAEVDIASSDQWPQIFLRLRSGISRPEPDFVGGENSQLSLQADYELDLWGRIRYSKHAEEHRLMASYYDYKAAALSLSGEVVTAWFQLKGLNKQLNILNEQVETNEKMLSLIRARFQSGFVKGVDILRQEQLLAGTRQQQINLEIRKINVVNRMHRLLGMPSTASIETSATLPEMPPLPAMGVALDLINRRPDIQRSFYTLQASDREVAAAISNKYPRINFSLSAALRSNSLTNIVESQAVSLTSSILAPLFYGGRLSAEVDRQEAIRQQQLYAYSHAVLTAFQEVENALMQEDKLIQQFEVVKEQVDLANKSSKQLRLEYLNGSLSYLDVLTTLSNQQRLEIALVDTELLLIQTRIALYRALAGGFMTERENDVDNDS